MIRRLAAPTAARGEGQTVQGRVDGAERAAEGHGWVGGAVAHRERQASRACQGQRAVGRGQGDLHGVVAGVVADDECGCRWPRRTPAWQMSPTVCGPGTAWTGASLVASGVTVKLTTADAVPPLPSLIW